MTTGRLKGTTGTKEQRGQVLSNSTLLPATLRFGTDASGLTAAQIASINNRGAKVAIDVNGYLYRIAPGTAIIVQ